MRRRSTLYLSRLGPPLPHDLEPGDSHDLVAPLVPGVLIRVGVVGLGRCGGGDCGGGDNGAEDKLAQDEISFVRHAHGASTPVTCDSLPLMPRRA